MKVSKNLPFQCLYPNRSVNFKFDLVFFLQVCRFRILSEVVKYMFLFYVFLWFLNRVSMTGSFFT